MIWILATASDYSPAIDAFPTLEALVAFLEETFPAEAGEAGTLMQRIDRELAGNDDLQDVRVFAVSPASCRQTAIDLDAVAAKGTSAHGRRILTRQARAALDLGTATP